MTEDLVQWDKVKGLEKSKLDQLLDLRREKKAIMETAKEGLDAVNSTILTLLAKVGVETVGVGETRVTLVPGGPTTKFDRKKAYTKLLDLGVKPKVVERAFKFATSKGEGKDPYILVTEPKEKKEKGK